MNITYEAKPYASRTQKLLYMLLGMIVLVGIMYLATLVFAGPPECPKGQEGNCSTYRHARTNKLGCFPNQANLGANWVFLYAGCDHEPGPNKPDPTAVPTQAQPAPTPQPTAPPPQVVPPDAPPADVNVPQDPKKQTLPTLAFEPQPTACCGEEVDCLCAIATQMARQNDLYELELNLYATEVSK